jgi:hypothetical protein
MIGKCLLLAAIVWIVGSEQVFKFKKLDFEFLKSDSNINNSLPTGLARHGNRLYVGVARRNLGIPSTLNYIDLSDYLTGTNPVKKSPLLIPYPDESFNELDVGILDFFRVEPLDPHFLSADRFENPRWAFNLCISP